MNQRNNKMPDMKSATQNPNRHNKHYDFHVKQSYQVFS